MSSWALVFLAGFTRIASFDLGQPIRPSRVSSTVWPASMRTSVLARSADSRRRRLVAELLGKPTAQASSRSSDPEMLRLHAAALGAAAAPARHCRSAIACAAQLGLQERLQDARRGVGDPRLEVAHAGRQRVGELVAPLRSPRLRARAASSLRRSSRQPLPWLRRALAAASPLANPLPSGRRSGPPRSPAADPARRGSALAPERHGRASRRAAASRRRTRSERGQRAWRSCALRPAHPLLEDGGRLLLVEVDHLLEPLLRRAPELARQVGDQVGLLTRRRCRRRRIAPAPPASRWTAAAPPAPAAGAGRGSRIARIAGRTPNQISSAATATMAMALMMLPDVAQQLLDDADARRRAPAPGRPARNSTAATVMWSPRLASMPAADRDQPLDLLELLVDRFGRRLVAERRREPLAVDEHGDGQRSRSCSRR